MHAKEKVIKHWKFKQSIAFELLKMATDRQRLDSTGISSSLLLTSDHPVGVSELSVSQQHVDSVHRLINELGRRRIKCQWQTEEGRCKNTTANRCISCLNRKGTPLMLCGIHFRAHKVDELNKIVN